MPARTARDDTTALGNDRVPYRQHRSTRRTANLRGGDSADDGSLMHVFFGVDDCFARPLAMTLASILASARPGDEYYFHVLHCGLSQENQSRICELEKDFSFLIEFRQLEEEDFRACPLSEGTYLSAATYFRLAIARLYPSLSKGIYLDCDIVVKTSLAELWETDVHGFPIAAVEELWDWASGEYKYRLGLQEDQHVFNAGILLINLEHWRVYDIERYCYDAMPDLISRGAFQNADQDVLNKVFSGHFKILPAKWNAQQTLYLLCSDNVSYTWEELQEARETPAIIHYTGDLKPWHTGCLHPLRTEISRYMNMTDWGPYTQPRGLRDCLFRYKRLVRMPRFFRFEFWMQSPARRKIWRYVSGSRLRPILDDLAEVGVIRLSGSIGRFLFRYVLIDAAVILFSFVRIAVLGYKAVGRRLGLVAADTA